MPSTDQPSTTNISIPTPLRGFTEGHATVAVQGKTVGEALNDLTTRYPTLRKHLYTDDGDLRSFINIYVNDEDIRYLERENTLLRAQDHLSIIPSIAGGSQ